MLRQRLSSIALVLIATVLLVIVFGWGAIGFVLAGLLLWWGQRKAEAYMRNREAARDESS